MAMPHARPQFSDLLYPGLNKIYLMTLDSYPTEWDKFLNVETSTRAWEEDLIVDGFGMIPEKAEGGLPAFDNIVISSKLQYVHKTYVLGYEVTEELFEDEQYNVIRRATTMLATAVKQTQDVLGATVLNNAFSAAHVGVDGLALCHVAHPQSKAGGTVSNRPAVDCDFDPTTLQAATEAIEQWKDANDFPMLKRPKWVVSGPQQRNIITKTLGSTLQPFTTDNEINAIRELELEKMILHYLTDDDAWFILTRKEDHYMKWFWRIKPRFRNYDDPSSGNARFLTRFRCSNGFTTWQGTYGSPGA